VRRARTEKNNYKGGKKRISDFKRGKRIVELYSHEGTNTRRWKKKKKGRHSAPEWSATKGKKEYIYNPQK